MDEDSETRKEDSGAARYLEQRLLCLDHAGDLVSGAQRVLEDDNALQNIAYHLAILAMEEIGKAGMLASRVAIGVALDDGKWLERRLGDHVFKLMWAVWSPSMSEGKIDPKDFEAARQFAESTHARRIAGLYVDHTDDKTPAPPREAVRLDHATSILSLARARLALELESGTPVLDERNEDLEWYLDTLTDALGKKRLFSRPFIQKYEEFHGDTRAWIRWAREEFAKIAAEEQEHLQRELTRQVGESGEGKPKWVMKVRLHTPSHSFHKKTLNFWNDRMEAVKLRQVGKLKNELLLEMTINDRVKLDRLFYAGLSLSKMYIAMLNIGTGGFFWYELSSQAHIYYESIQDLDAPHLKPCISQVHGLLEEWAEETPDGGYRKLVALEETHLTNSMMCLAAFGPWAVEDLAPIFGPYLEGLMLFSKTDLHLSVENNARDAFLKVLRRAMLSYGDWNGEDTQLITALHRVFEPIIPEEAHRNLLLKDLEGTPTDEKALSYAITAKRVADIYLVIVAKRRWQEFVTRAGRN
ncbi:MAG: AbiV family abortive infection protein [Nitrospirales bacterium]